MLQTLRGGEGTSRDQKQPTQGCTSEEVTLYEAYVDVVDGGFSYGGDVGVRGKYDYGRS